MRVSTDSAPYQVFMLALCIYALAALGVQAAFRPDAEVRALLQYADTAVCAVFFIDFLISLYRAPNRWRYFYTWGWLDLLSSVPALDAARWGRAARIARIFRVLRGLRAARILAQLVLERRAQSTFLAAALVALLLLVVASVSILLVETTADSNIRSAGDAVWWALTTITTVGYGDRYPVTTEGRVVAGLLMCAGVGLFGMFSGFLASWFVAPATAEERSEIQELREEIRQLRAALDMAATVGAAGLPGRPDRTGPGR